MSNYIKAVDFAAKDSLLTGDPLKIVSGTEIDDECNAIQTAINSKANTNSPALTGSPTAPTATAGTNTTQISTTAFVTGAINTAKSALYPVGSIYTNATSNTNPATLLGFGTWVAFGAGRVPVGFDSSNTLFDTAEETGGSADSVLPSHTHTVTVDSDNSLSSSFSMRRAFFNATVNNIITAVTGAFSTANTGSGAYLDAGGSNLNSSLQNISLDGEHSHTATASTEGVSGTNANLQPYITVYMWKRVS